VACLGPTGRILAMLALLLAAACAPWQPGQKDSRAGTSQPHREPPAAPRRASEPAPPWYTVKRGDSLYSIAFRYSLDWRNLARWNGVDAPYTIRPGQELRTSAPPRVASNGQSAQKSPASSGRRPTEPDRASSGSSKAGTRPAATAKTPPAASQQKAPTAASQPKTRPAPNAAVSSASGKTRTVGGVVWQWPVDAGVKKPFDPASTRKGLGLAGREGQDVVAAASGTVVYSGSNMRGYGAMVIIKHTSSLFSAYAHNRRLVVNEGSEVKRGQKIAELGLDDRRQELLHFEIRRDGKPVNPLDYLPQK